MATIHLTYGHAGTLPSGPKRSLSALSLIGFATASQTMTGTSGTSTIGAGPATAGRGDPIARVYSDQDVKVAFAAAPTSATPWHFLPAGETHDFGVWAGDKMYFSEVA